MTVIKVYGETIGKVIESAPLCTKDELLDLINYDEERLCEKYGWDGINYEDIEIVR